MRTSKRKSSACPWSPRIKYLDRAWEWMQTSSVDDVLARRRSREHGLESGGRHGALAATLATTEPCVKLISRFAAHRLVLRRALRQAQRVLGACSIHAEGDHDQVLAHVHAAD